MDSLDLLRTFREVARRNSFAGAARALDIDEAALARLMAGRG